MTGVFNFATDRDRRSAEAAVGLCLGKVNATPYRGHPPHSLICCGSSIWTDRIELTFRPVDEATPPGRPSSDWSRLPPLRFDPEGGAPARPKGKDHAPVRPSGSGDAR